ncbi:beta-lactamase family protein [Sphingomonas sp. SUN019]|uniref:serine hydrolase domain-containing protein n=1 Tax=Sphingomonas sp. SUN019 TaxID=2937788 RepID=UPI0021643A0A|nr:serine hydrolase [Sphingomonas sp. SUN019]UVO49275.1 beta-lactamase family protein [Sphingomonas sp. SUN019]
MRYAIRNTALAAILLAATTPAAAQQPIAVRPTIDTAYTRAIAAGYKAAMLCSSVFNAGRNEAQIERDELRGIYPDYAAIVPTLAATVDRRRAVVTVAWSSNLPPRRAEWSRGKGCTTMPIGAFPPPVVNSFRTPPSPAPADPRPWPMGDGGIVPRPAPALGEAVARAFDRSTYGRGSETVGVVILRDGRIVAERYREGFGPFVSNRTWSVAKSIAGMAIGAAQAERRIDVAARVRIPEWGAWPRDPRVALTTDQLLRMSSGLHSATAGNRTDAVYFGGTAVTEETTGWPLEAQPGTRFRYANNDILLAVRGLRASMNDDRAYAALMPSFFARLGMTHSVAETDWRGNYILSSQVWSTARDLARFGLFMAQDGVWQGQRILPAGWMAQSIRPVGPQPEGREGYGRTLWLFGPQQGLPAGSYAAQGNRGQYVMVIPSHRLVIVRRGEDGGAARFEIARFAADVMRDAAGRR